MTRPVVSADPAISWGRPAIRGISTEAIADHIDAGEDFAAVATDYGLTVHEVVLACWFEGLHGHYRRRWRAWAEAVHGALAGEAFDPQDIEEPPTTDDQQ